VTARLLTKALANRTAGTDQRPDLARRWDIWRREKQKRDQEDSPRGIASATVFAAMNRTVPEDAIIAVDVGNNTEQRAGHWDVWQTALHSPNFAEYADLCGALGIRVTSKTDLDSSIERALDYQGPSLVEIVTDPELI